MKSWIGQRSKPESYHFDSFCTGKSVSLWWAMKVMTIPRSSQTRTSSSRYINTDMVGYSELMSYPWYCRLKKDEKGIYKDVSMAGDLLYRNLQRFVPSVFYNHSSFCNLFLSAGKRQTICGLEAFCGWILNDRKYHMPISSGGLMISSQDSNIWFHNHQKQWNRPNKSKYHRWGIPAFYKLNKSFVKLLRH